MLDDDWLKFKYEFGSALVYFFIRYRNHSLAGLNSSSLNSQVPRKTQNIDMPLMSKGFPRYMKPKQ